MGRTACTEPQCLYKGDLYLYLSALDEVKDRFYENCVRKRKSERKHEEGNKLL